MAAGLLEKNLKLGLEKIGSLDGCNLLAQKPFVEFRMTMSVEKRLWHLVHLLHHIF
eukprot:c41152_g1_i1 orf=54-221(-)